MSARPSPYAVRLADIPSEGLERAYDLSGAFAEQALAGTEATVAGSTISAALTLYKTGREVLARGGLKGDVHVLCSRCAGPAAISIEEPFQILFVPRGARRDQPDPEEAASAGEPDVESYDGEEIDLAETLREEVLLALPIAPLCAETCRGLCSRCGADLNQGPCGCPAEPRDERLAALRNVKL